MKPLHITPFCSISASGPNFNPQNTQCIPAVARSEATALYYRVDSELPCPSPCRVRLRQIQFCYPAKLLLNLNEIEHFSKVSTSRHRISRTIEGFAWDASGLVFQQIQPHGKSRLGKVSECISVPARNDESVFTSLSFTFIPDNLSIFKTILCG